MSHRGDPEPPGGEIPGATPSPGAAAGPSADRRGRGDPGAPAPVGPSTATDGGERMSAILTAPNVISFTRLLLMPVCAWLLASGRWGAGLCLTALVGSTDWVDGWLARRTGSVSRLGQLLDPLADRLLIASVTVALLVRGVLPLVAVLLLVGRDLLLLAGFPLLARRGVRPPDVIRVGKAATLVLLFALPILTLGETGVGFAAAARTLGLALLAFGIVLYYVAGMIYVRMALQGLRAARSGR
jgi:cardiolipin synthase (CMP-forming)